MLDPTHEWNKDIKATIISYLVSIALTVVIYFFAIKDFLILPHLAFTLVGLAIVQAIVQLVFFFQISNEEKPRWNLLSLLFTIMVIVIIIGGSMWIMSSVNYNLMPSMPDMPGMAH